MTCFDPLNQLLASLHIYSDQTLDDLSVITEGNLDRWRIGLRDVLNWDNDVLDQEIRYLTEVDPSFESLLCKVVYNPPTLKEFLHCFMSELCKLSSVKNREYFTNFGHKDRGDVQMTVLTHVIRKLDLTMAIIVETVKTPKKIEIMARNLHDDFEVCSTDSVSCVPAKNSMAYKKPIPKGVPQSLPEDHALSSLPPSLFLPENIISSSKYTKAPSQIRESRTGSRAVSQHGSEFISPPPAPTLTKDLRSQNTMQKKSHISEPVSVDCDKVMSIVSESPQATDHVSMARSQASTMNFSRFSSVPPCDNSKSRLSTRFPSALDDLMSGVSLVR